MEHVIRSNSSNSATFIAAGPRRHRSQDSVLKMWRVCFWCVRSWRQTADCSALAGSRLKVERGLQCPPVFYGEPAWAGGSIRATTMYNPKGRLSLMTLIAPRITVDPQIRFGKPVIEGTRVPVSVVVGAVAAGDSWREIAQEYGIAEEDIRAALAYAANRLEEETVRAPI